MSTQRSRRHFRNTRNNKEHKLKLKSDELRAKEAKLQKLKESFNESLRELVQFEEINIFSRDGDGTISDVLIENKILKNTLFHYETLINDEKRQYKKLQDSFYNLSGEICLSSLDMECILKQIEIFYGDLDEQLANQSKFERKLIDKLTNLNEEISLISPLIFGKNVQSPSKIAIQCSSIYSAIKMEEKQFERIKETLKEHQHWTLTTKTSKNTPGSDTPFGGAADTHREYKEYTHRTLKSSKYEMTDLKQIETKISKLRYVSLSNKRTETCVVYKTEESRFYEETH